MNFVQLTQAIYNGLGTWDSNTLYFCTDTNRIYLGTALMSRPAQELLTLASEEELLAPSSVVVERVRKLHWHK